MSFMLLWYARRRALQESAAYVNAYVELNAAAPPSPTAAPLASPDVEMASAQRDTQTGGRLLSSGAATHEVASADVEMEGECKDGEPTAGANRLDTRSDSVHEEVRVDESMELCTEEKRASASAEVEDPPLEDLVKSTALDGNEASGESMVALLLGPDPDAAAAAHEDPTSRISTDAHVESSGATAAYATLRSGKRWRMCRGTSQDDCDADPRTMDAVEGAATRVDGEETETENEGKDMEDELETKEEGSEDVDTEGNDEEDASRGPTKRRRTASGKRCCSHLDCPKQAQMRGLCVAHGGARHCSHQGCTKQAQQRGLCKAHGGTNPCAHPGCTKKARKKGLCHVHAGKRKRSQ